MVERRYKKNGEKGRIEVAGLLHNIGIIGVGEKILKKSQKLTQEE